jgi:hypothetical protein
MADLFGAFFTHPENLAAPGRRLLDRVISGYMLNKLLQQLQKGDHECGGFYHPTSGMAAMFLDLLRDPHTRKDFLRLTRVSPESFRNDEDYARKLAVAWMIGNLAKMFDAEFNKRFGQFCHERRNAQTLHDLDDECFEEDAKRHVWKAMARLEAAMSRSVDDIVLYAGRSLERDFRLRAPRLVAELVTDAFGLTPKMKERRARHLCRLVVKTPPGRTPDGGKLP